MSLKDNINATLAMESALGTPSAELPLVVTNADMAAHATAAVARGAAFLDRRQPGWVERALPTITPFPKVSELPFYMQVGLLPRATLAEVKHALATETKETGDARRAANVAAITAEEGEQRYTPLFTREQIHEGAALVAQLTGMPVPAQEAFDGRETQIDLAFYGFTVAYMTGAFGLPAGTKPTRPQLDATGYCKDKVAEFLAAAWNEELTTRRGK